MKQQNRTFIPRLLVVGATSPLRSLQGKTSRLALRAQALLTRRPKKVVICEASC
jgi:hypothetical protein